MVVGDRRLMLPVVSNDYTVAELMNEAQRRAHVQGATHLITYTGCELCADDRVCIYMCAHLYIYVVLHLSSFSAVVGENYICFENFNVDGWGGYFWLVGCRCY